MSFNYCYDPTEPGWGGKVQTGTDALRDVMLAKVPELTDLGIIRDKSRCNQKSSTHCYGRAWDPGTPNKAINIKLGQFFVDAALDLGIQRVIGYGKRSDGTVGYREWDSRPGQRFWSRYTGPEHLSHVHVEHCWEAARRLTAQQVHDAYDRYWPDQEDDVTPEQAAQIQRIEDNQKLILTYLGGKDPDAVGKAVGRGDIISDVDFKVALAKAEGFNHKTGKPPVAPEGP